MLEGFGVVLWRMAPQASQTLHAASLHICGGGGGGGVVLLSIALVYIK